MKRFLLLCAVVVATGCTAAAPAPESTRPIGADTAGTGPIRMKLGWWRTTEGELRITGSRIDGSAPALTGTVPKGYGERGFQSSSVSFPAEGCWRVTGVAGVASLTFVTYVTR